MSGPSPAPKSIYDGATQRGTGVNFDDAANLALSRSWLRRDAFCKLCNDIDFDCGALALLIDTAYNAHAPENIDAAYLRLTKHIDLFPYEALVAIGREGYPFTFVSRSIEYERRVREDFWDEDLPGDRASIGVISLSKLVKCSTWTSNQIATFRKTLRGFKPWVLSGFFAVFNSMPDGFGKFVWLNDNLRLWSLPRKPLVAALSRLSDSIKKWPQFWQTKFADPFVLCELGASFGNMLDTKDFPDYDVTEAAEELALHGGSLNIPEWSDSLVELLNSLRPQPKGPVDWGEWFTGPISEFATDGSMSGYKRNVQGEVSRLNKAPARAFLTQRDVDSALASDAVIKAIVKREVRPKAPRIIYSAPWVVFLFWSYAINFTGDPISALSQTMIGKRPVDYLQWCYSWVTNYLGDSWAAPFDVAGYDHIFTVEQERLFLETWLSRAPLWVKNTILDYWAETYVVDPAEAHRLFKRLSGLVSGVPWTSAFGTTANLAIFNSISKQILRVLDRPPLIKNEIAQGDDFLANIPSVGVGFLFVALASKQGVPIHPSKNWFSSSSVEFLKNRVSYADKKVCGYLARVAQNWVERSPDSAPDITGREMASRAWVVFCDNIGRGGDFEFNTRCLMSEIDHAASLDASVASSVVAGGAGFGRSLNRFVERSPRANIDAGRLDRFRAEVLRDIGDLRSVFTADEVTSIAESKRTSSFRYLGAIRPDIKAMFRREVPVRSGKSAPPQVPAVPRHTHADPYFMWPFLFPVSSLSNPDVVSNASREISRFARSVTPLASAPWWDPLMSSRMPWLQKEAILRRVSISGRASPTMASFTLLSSQLRHCERSVRVAILSGSIPYDRSPELWFPSKCVWLLNAVLSSVAYSTLAANRVRWSHHAFASWCCSLAEFFIPILRAGVSFMSGA